MRERTIELLAPAGDMERLRMAVAYGADAVYLAGTTFGMRSFAGNVTPEDLGAGSMSPAIPCPGTRRSLVCRSGWNI